MLGLILTHHMRDSSPLSDLRNFIVTENAQYFRLHVVICSGEHYSQFSELVGLPSSTRRCSSCQIAVEFRPQSRQNRVGV